MCSISQSTFTSLFLLCWESLTQSRIEKKNIPRIRAVCKPLIYTNSCGTNKLWLGKFRKVQEMERAENRSFKKEQTQNSVLNPLSIHLTCFILPLQGKGREHTLGWSSQGHAHTPSTLTLLTPQGNLKSPGDLNTHVSWTVGGNQCTRKKNPRRHSCWLFY